LRTGDAVVEGSVIGGSVSLSKVVGFNLSGVSSQPFPIDLVKIIRFHDETADNALAGGCLHANSDLSEEDVTVTRYGWRLSFLSHGEVGAVCAIVGERGSCGKRKEVAFAFGEVNGDSFAESCVGRTSLNCRVTVGVGLSRA